MKITPLFLFIASIAPAQAQFTQQEKAACVGFMGGSNAKLGALERMNALDNLLDGLPKIDKGAVEADSEANKIAATRAKGLNDNAELKQAESIARYGEKSLRIKYCGECKVVKSELDKLEKEYKAKCQKIAPEYQEFIDGRRKHYTESCEKKKPYDEACKAK